MSNVLVFEIRLKLCMLLERKLQKKERENTRGHSKTISKNKIVKNTTNENSTKQYTVKGKTT